MIVTVNCIGIGQVLTVAIIIIIQTVNNIIQTGIRAREIDKCKSVQPFHKQSAISVSFTETTDRPFPRSRKLPIGSFRNDRPFPDIR